MVRARRLRVYLAGPAGVGKTKVAEGLASRYGFQRISLGDLVREECIRLGLPLTRANLQAVGDLLRRDRDDDAALAAMALERALPEVRGVVVDGVRLVAEAEALRCSGFVGVGIHARDDLRLDRLRARDGSADVPEHRTEREAERVPVDLRFVNLSEDPVVFGHGLEYLLSRLRHSGGEGRALRAGATLR